MGETLSDSARHLFSTVNPFPQSSEDDAERRDADNFTIDNDTVSACDSMPIESRSEFLSGDEESKQWTTGSVKHSNQFTEIIRQQPQIKSKEFIPFPSPRFEQESKAHVDDIQRSILKDKKKKKIKRRKNKNRANMEEEAQLSANPEEALE